MYHKKLIVILRIIIRLKICFTRLLIVMMMLLLLILFLIRNVYYVRDDNHICSAYSDNPIATSSNVLDIGNYQIGLGKRHVKYVQFKENGYRILYEDIDNGNKYEIWLFTSCDIFKIVDEILDEKKNISSISDIVYTISNVVSLKEIFLDVKDLNNNGKISLYLGNLGHYEEYFDMKDFIEKKYLENGKFYIEQIYKRKIEKDRIPFVKKIGGIYE